ncbi:DedA family protein [Rhizobium deserti]|uniref:DedA family protein n=2 Tax=Rhizobium deserti TaxID=2547961 RepID=A0A4R5U9E0_9HYPH|nr:DedA family protein [Rhizobium deserti]
MEAFVQATMERFGALGIGLLMFLENIFPPIPSELIMPLAGYLSTQGDMGIVTVIAAGSTGSLLGIMPWYFLARKVGAEKLKAFAAKHGRWLTMSPTDIDTASDRFREHGNISVLVGRLIPTVRTLISVPAGIARMPFWQFCVFSAVGSVIWTATLALAGYGLGQAYETVKNYVDPIATTVLCLLIIAYLYRVITFKR